MKGARVDHDVETERFQLECKKEIKPPINYTEMMHFGQFKFADKVRQFHIPDRNRNQVGEAVVKDDDARRRMPQHKPVETFAPKAKRSEILAREIGGFDVFLVPRAVIGEIDKARPHNVRPRFAMVKFYAAHVHQV